MAKAKKVKKALKKKAAPAKKAGRKSGRGLARASPKAKPARKQSAKKATPQRGATKSSARKTAARKIPAKRAAPAKAKANKVQKKVQKSEAPKAVARKAPPKTALAAAPAPAKKAASAPAHHRLPPAQRHAVETDDPRERAGDGNEKAFVGTDTDEDEAKELGEEFVRSVTSGEEAESEMEEEEAVEEQGGPFLITSARTEYGFGTDESNPADAEKAPFPKVSPAVSPNTDGEEEDQ